MYSTIFGGCLREKDLLSNMGERDAEESSDVCGAGTHTSLSVISTTASGSFARTRCSRRAPAPTPIIRCWHIFCLTPHLPHFKFVRTKERGETFAKSQMHHKTKSHLSILQVLHNYRRPYLGTAHLGACQDGLGQFFREEFAWFWVPQSARLSARGEGGGCNR